MREYEIVCTKLSLGGNVQFKWDTEKARSNLVKHHVSFELAKHVWDDPYHVIVADRFQDGEQRWHAVGMVGPVAILVVVHSYPADSDDNVIRIIGARKATSHERRRYEQSQI